MSLGGRGIGLDFLLSRGRDRGGKEERGRKKGRTGWTGI